MCTLVFSPVTDIVFDFVVTLSECDSGKKKKRFLARDWCVLQNMKCVKEIFM